MRDTVRDDKYSIEKLSVVLADYLQRFTTLVALHDESTDCAAELRQVMANYTTFVTDDRNEAPLDDIKRCGPADFADLVADLRMYSARGASIMEKYRAVNLLDGHAEVFGYFDNVESSIEEEFGAFQLTAASKVMLVGSGSFPMTPLYIAERTGASVVGVDVDYEAVDLGQRVIQLLGSALDITLENTPAEDLLFSREATHIIFSSTVEAKYDLLHLLHPLTRDDVVVAMRFGDGLKSLFNYPMQEVDPAKWRVAETVRRPNHVFDVALYVKVKA